jgi:hypothetical protein
MMVNSVHPGGGGGCTPSPFYYVYHHEQSLSVRSSWEGRYTPPTSSLPLYVLCGLHINLPTHKMVVLYMYDISHSSLWSSLGLTISLTHPPAQAAYYLLLRQLVGGGGGETAVSILKVGWVHTMTRKIGNMTQSQKICPSHNKNKAHLLTFRTCVHIQ